ncbi:MAG: hypothetical protein AVDCRST_MAG53-1843, partial [uncultured Solirubrobacteraceae bacterium]
ERRNRRREREDCQPPAAPVRLGCLARLGHAHHRQRRALRDVRVHPRLDGPVGGLARRAADRRRLESRAGAQENAAWKALRYEETQRPWPSV